MNPVWVRIGTLETFTELKELVENPHYRVHRRKALCKLTDDMIDVPIIRLIKGFNRLPYCFTLQSCYGHFVCKGQNNLHNFDPLPVKGSTTHVTYRIAYIACCIENSASGKGFLEGLKEITSIDPENVQFCCADWFWKRQVNSYALQVEPDRFKHKDQAMFDYKEALHIENVRDQVFIRLDKLIENACGK